MKKLHFIFYIITVLFLLDSCKKDVTTKPLEIGKSYFPFKVGAYVIYDVDSTFYDDFFIPSKAINTKFQLKEKIQSLYYDNQNRLTARLERYTKLYDSTTPYSAIKWTLKNVWAENVTSTTAEKVEENVRYVKLVFPIKLNKTWNMNVQNYLDSMYLTYKSINTADNIGGIQFDSVLQTEYDDGGAILTSRIYFSEKYACNAGLVYKKVIEVQSQPDPTSTSSQLQLFYAMPIMKRITSGYQYTWTVNSYGKE